MWITYGTHWDASLVMSSGPGGLRGRNDLRVPVQNIVRVTEPASCGTQTRDVRMADSHFAGIVLGNRGSRFTRGRDPDLAPGSSSY